MGLWLILGKHNDFVYSFSEPGSRNVDGLLGSEIPETAEGMTVDPDGSLAPSAGVQKGVAGFAQVKLPR
jgi:hypothetical protein